MTSGLWRFAIAVGCLLLASAAQAERRVALVIGNSAYRHVSRLPNPVNDAGAVAALFRTAGFDSVELRQDLGVADLRRVLREFAEATRDADVAVLYYAGHGIEVNGSNYLIPVDAKLASDFDVEDEAFSLERALKVLEPARRLRLVILDACRDNPFAGSMKRSMGTRAINRGLAKVEPTTSNTLIAFAAKAGSVAADGDGLHSPFTAALIEHIASPGLDLRIAFGLVRDAVVARTQGAQEPFVYGSLGGSTVSIVGGEPPRQASPSMPPAWSPPVTADPGAAARQDYEAAERIGTKEAWRSFLARHGSGFYADLARAAIAKLDALEARLHAPVSRPTDAGTSPAQRPETKPPRAEPRMNILDGMDLPGNDYRDIRDVDFGTCQNSCRADAQCRAFTYNRRASVCFLKEAVGEESAHRDAISGVYGQPPRRRSRVDEPTGSVPYHYVTGLDPNGWNWLALREAPSPSASWSRTVQIGPDTPLTVLGQSGGYHRVKLRSGESGWVSAQHVSCCRNERDKPSYHFVSGLCLTCADPWIQLRTQPGYAAPVVPNLKIKSGALLTVLGRDQDWLHVRLRGGETGWANSKYVSCCR